MARIAAMAAQDVPFRPGPWGRVGESAVARPRPSQRPGSVAENYGPESTNQPAIDEPHIAALIYRLTSHVLAHLGRHGLVPTGFEHDVWRETID